MTEKTAWYRRMPTAALQRGFTLPNLLNITYVDTAKVSGWFNQRRKPSGLSRGPPPKASCKQIFQAFGKLYKPYFCDKKSRWRAWPLLLICVIFMYFEVQTGVDISDAVKDVNNALVAQEKDQFYQELRNAALIAVRLIPILLMHLGAACYLALDWRKYLTQKVLDMYVDEKQCFYRLKTEYGNLDNPDQRIAQDIGNFCRMSLRLMSALVLDVFKIAANSAALIQISAFLFYTLVGCSFLYTFVSLVIFAAPMMRVQRRILAVEGDLRYVLVRLREHAESVAFFRGHQYERQCSDKVLDHVIWSNYKKAAIEVTFRMVTGVVQMAFMLMPMMIVAPMFLSGAVTFGTIQQSQILFANLMSGMMDLGKAKAGVFLDVARELLAKLPAASFDGVVFLDQSDRKMILVRSSAGFRAVSLVTSGVVPERRFAFFDQVHTTGMDILTAPCAKAVLTVGKDTWLQSDQLSP
ncbi:unnamed protein product [Effrenium voratum]|nr:unnamed protein product [Effrenium voratum]